MRRVPLGSWLIGAAITGVVLLTIFAVYTGVNYQDKTLWDSLDLLGTVAAPVVIAGAGYWYTRREARRTQAITDERSQDTALQNYLGQMGELLIDKGLRKERDGTERRNMARALTLGVLEGLSPDRKRSVVRFLYGAGLIYTPVRVVALDGADLKYANLEGMHLCYRRGTGEDLLEAERTGVSLADLAEPVASANLSGVNLTGANLKDTDLGGVDLSFADLRNACLVGADLKDAILIEAKVFDEQLRSCKTLEGATMPDGEPYD